VTIKEMMNRLLITLMVFVAVFGLVAGLPAQAPPAQTTPEVQEPPPVLVVPPGYKYNPRGRRDPFVNPVPKPAPSAVEIPVVRPPGLKGVLVTEALIGGIVTSREPSMNVALILAPGGKTYFATKNDTLFDAVIKEIQADAVVFALTPPGRPANPAVPAREIVRKVRSTGENK
jgi:hypothetical protein